MRAGGRKTACVVMLLFFAWAASRASAASKDASPDPDDPRLAGRFSGRVTGAGGQPVTGARLYVVPWSNDLRGRVVFPPEPGTIKARAQTDAMGRFAFDAPDMTLVDLDGLPTRRRCLLIATRAGHGPDWTETRGRIGASQIQRPIRGTNVSLQLATDDVPIEGRLLDPDGRPLAGARVRLTELMIPRGRDLDAHLAREAKATALTSGPRYERRLDRLPALPGLVLETRSDAEGRFTLNGLGRDRLARLWVTAPQVVDTHLTVMTRRGSTLRTRRLPGGEPTSVIHPAQFTLKLKPGRTVRGVVIDRDSRAPVAGMWVGMSFDSPRQGLKRGTYDRATDAQGRFTISGIDPLLLEIDRDDRQRQVYAVAPPGLSYQTVSATAREDADVVIECPRGIPFRLKLLDDAGRAVRGEVTYIVLAPNPHVSRQARRVAGYPFSHALQRADGTYAGFVLPGPGAVQIKAAGLDYREAYVEPEEFFAADRTQPSGDAPGNEPATPGAKMNQLDFDAIVLVNPPPDSGPLELSATVVRDTPRQVSLVDAKARPVAGATTQGMTPQPYDFESPLRAASFPLRRLHPKRPRPIIFRKDDRRLIGFLLARADGDEPYTVRMQRWSALSGRLVDQSGKPISGASITLLSDAPRRGVKTDRQGRFRITRLVAGLAYSAKVYRGRVLRGAAFDNVVLRAGEERKLGDIRFELLVWRM